MSQESDSVSSSTSAPESLSQFLTHVLHHGDHICVCMKLLRNGKQMSTITFKLVARDLSDPSNEEILKVVVKDIQTVFQIICSTPTQPMLLMIEANPKPLSTANEELEGLMEDLSNDLKVLGILKEMIEVNASIQDNPSKPVPLNGFFPI